MCYTAFDCCIRERPRYGPASVFEISDILYWQSQGHPLGDFVTMQRSATSEEFGEGGVNQMAREVNWSQHTSDRSLAEIFLIHLAVRLKITRTKASRAFEHLVHPPAGRSSGLSVKDLETSVRVAQDFIMEMIEKCVNAHSEDMPQVRRKNSHVRNTTDEIQVPTLSGGQWHRSIHIGPIADVLTTIDSGNESLAPDNAPSCGESGTGCTNPDCKTVASPVWKSASASLFCTHIQCANCQATGGCGICDKLAASKISSVVGICRKVNRTKTVASANITDRFKPYQIPRSVQASAARGEYAHSVPDISEPVPKDDALGDEGISDDDGGDDEREEEPTPAEHFVPKLAEAASYKGRLSTLATKLGMH